MTIYIVQYVYGYNNATEIISAHRSIECAEYSRDAAAKQVDGVWDRAEIATVKLED